MTIKQSRAIYYKKYNNLYKIAREKNIKKIGHALWQLPNGERVHGVENAIKKAQ